MSRIGKQPIAIPTGVDVSIQEGKVIVKGKLGELSQEIIEGLKVTLADGSVLVETLSDKRRVRAFHGLMRSLINNMIIGVSTGFSKTLEMVGVGYRAQTSGSKISLNAGYSKPVELELPQGIKAEIENNTIIKISGIDKQLVGQIASQIRTVRKPEPYKGKGIKYQGEKIIRKAGKAAKVGGA